MVWWGHWRLAAATATGVWTLASPVLMTSLIRHFSGVTQLESTLQERPGYREYVERTSPFFPLPPRQRREDR